jgi:hypothetical protein
LKVAASQLARAAFFITCAIAAAYVFGVVIPGLFA